MAIKFNPMEYIQDLVDMGYTRHLAVIMAKEESAKRHKQDKNQIKADNDYLMDRLSQHVTKRGGINNV